MESPACPPTLSAGRQWGSEVCPPAVSVPKREAARMLPRSRESGSPPRHRPFGGKFGRGAEKKRGWRMLTSR